MMTDVDVLISSWQCSQPFLLQLVSISLRTGFGKIQDQTNKMSSYKLKYSEVQYMTYHIHYQGRAGHQKCLFVKIHTDFHPEARLRGAVLTVVKFSGPQSLPLYLQSSSISSMLWLVLCTNSSMLKVLLGKNLLLSVGCPNAAMKSSKSLCSTPRSPAIQKMSFLRICDFRKLL